MTNIDKVSLAVSEWLFNVAAAYFPKFKIPTDSPIGKFMYGILGTDPATYNIWKELGFLAEPLIQTMVTPAVYKMLGNIPDEQIPGLAMKFAESFYQRAQEKGGVNLFGLELGPKSFEGLKAILTEKLDEDNG